MPVIRSAMKRVRQETVRRERNRKVRDELHAAIKALGKAIEAKDASKASQHLVSAQSQLARAAKKGLVHKNAAARRLSRLHARVKALGGPKPKAATKPKPATAKAAPAEKAVAKTTVKKQKASAKNQG